MFKLLGMLVVLLAGGIGVYAYWDVLIGQPQRPMRFSGSPTRLQDKRVPGFRPPGLMGAELETRDLLRAGKPIVVKFWGPWSPACILEYPLLHELREARVEMWAIAFRDSRTNVLDYLERNGNPYARVAYDAAGRVASDWGVTAAPSTFLVDGEGFVRWHRAGPLTEQIISRELMPLLQRYSP